MARRFTVEEANAALPRLRTLLRDAQDLKRQVDAAQKELDALTPPAAGNGHARDTRAIRLKARELDGLSKRLERALRMVRNLGCEIKDIDMGLVDFPALRGGQEVYLCWKVDETDVGWWHDLESGFGGRQPL